MRRQGGGRQRALRWVVVLAMCLALVPVVPAAGVLPTTWYVDPAGDDANPGTAAEPFATIGQAIGVAMSGDTIELAAGTYSDEVFPLVVTESLAFVGAGADETTVTPSEPARLFEVTSASAAGPVSFAGIAFVGGGDPDNAPGGAFYCAGSEVDFQDCTFSANSGFIGGAIFAGGAYLSITDSLFSYNGDETSDTPFGGAAVEDRETMAGGAIYAVESLLEITGSEFSDNGALAEAPAVLAASCEALVEDTVFNHNQVTQWLSPIGVTPTSFGDMSAQQILSEDAGALTFMDSWADVTGCSFGENLAYCGAGVTVGGGDVSVRDSVFTDNFTFTGAVSFQSVMTDSMADEYYTGERFSGASLMKPAGAIRPEVDSCVFTGTLGGGTVLGIYNMPGLVTNSVFVKNGILPDIPQVDVDEAHLASIVSVDPDPLMPPPPAGPAGSNGIDFGFGYVGVLNCTIADNDAQTGLLGTYAPIDSVNNIVWNGAGLESVTGFGGLMGCDLETTPTVVFPAEAAPAFAESIPMPEGTWFSEWPEFKDPEAGDYRVRPYSSCIDTGSDFVMPYVLYDFDGVERPIDGNEDGTAEWDVGAFEYDPWSDARIGGTDRYDTSVEVSIRHFPEGADTAILATGAKFADGLSAAGLAGTYDAPILLTDPLALPEGVGAELQRLGVSRVIIVGGSNAVSEDVADEVAGLGDITVERIGGIDRYETAAMIADEIIRIADEGDGFSGMLFIARGDLFADALTASPVAFSNRIPILLVAPDEMPEATVDVIRSASAERAVIVGGASAVEPVVATRVASLVETSDRVDGTDRYDTSANFSQWAVDGGLAEWAAVGIATGEKFPDALSGGAGIGTRGGVVMLSPSSSMHDSIADKLADVSAQVTSLEVFGGEGAVSPDVYDALLALVTDV